MDFLEIRILPIPKPDNDIRRFIIESVAPKITGFNEMNENERAENTQLFITQTNGFFACSDGVWEALPIDEIEKSLSCDDVFTACTELQKKMFSAECNDNVSFVFIP